MLKSSDTYSVVGDHDDNGKKNKRIAVSLCNIIISTVFLFLLGSLISCNGSDFIRHCYL